jgi:cytochrome c oxidase subunit 2
MAIVLVLVLLVVASLVFHVASPWWFTPLASNWGSIDTTITITLVITGTVFVAINLFMAYAIYRYRQRPSHHAIADTQAPGSHPADYEPENRKLEIWLTLITAIGVAAMLAPGLVVWAKFIDVPEEAHEIEVIGQQWEWLYRLPGADGILGEVHTRFIEPGNPFGMSPTDTNGLDDVLITDHDLHLPINLPVKVLLRSKDVLHNFAVPQFRVKMDLVPGLGSYLWFTPTRTGTFDILCMELCGIAHYTMRGQVTVDEQAEFSAWLARQTTWSEMRAIPRGDAQRGQAHYAMCAACHGLRGEGNAILNAPRLAGLADWYVERQIKHYQQGIRGTHAQDRYGQQMAQIANTLQDAQIIRDICTYIDSMDATLATHDATPTIKATKEAAERGADYYQTCSTCHGADGEGNAALNAPRLAGQQDWYLKRQLAHFRDGIRGSHQQDNYGRQMILMARTLQDEQAINELVTYLNKR